VETLATHHNKHLWVYGVPISSAQAGAALCAALRSADEGLGVYDDGGGVGGALQCAEVAGVSGGG